MPYGMSNSKYLVFLLSAGAMTMAGSNMVHNYYKPLADLDELVEKELSRRQAAATSDTAS